MSADELTLMIRAMLPAGARFAGGSVAGASGAVFDDELAALGTVAPKRLADFRAGRVYARRALAELDVVCGSLPIGTDRAPQWPPGVVGSISHADEYCGALVARRETYASIGFDIETARRIDDEIVRRIATPRELRDGARISPQLAGPYPALVFSAKESIYKAFAPLAKRFLDFHDVEIDVDAAASTFVGRVARGARESRAERSLAAGDEPHAFSGRFVFAEDAVVTWAIPAADRKHAACAG